MLGAFIIFLANLYPILFLFVITFGSFRVLYKRTKKYREKETTTNKKPVVKTEPIDDYFILLNDYLEKYHYLNINETTRLERLNNKPISNLNQIIIYQSNERLADLDQLKRKDSRLYETIKTKLDHIVEVKRKQGTFCDENRNAIEDHLESSRAEYYYEKFSEMKNFINDDQSLALLNQLLGYLGNLKIIEQNKTIKNTQLDKLYTSYLPMLNKIMINYQEFTLGYETVESTDLANKKILKTLKIANKALSNIIDSLAEKDYLDLSVDAKVFESLLQQDGLLEDNIFKKVK